MTIDSRIDTHCENVLMVLGKNSWIDNISVTRWSSGINIDTGHNSGSPDFDINLAGKIELVGKDVLVVRQGKDKLNCEFTVAGYDSSVGFASLCVSIQYRCPVHEANHIWLDFNGTIFGHGDCVEVLQVEYALATSHINLSRMGLTYFDRA